MKELPPLEQLTPAQKDALIRELWQRLQVLEGSQAQAAAKRVKKTSKNSSQPPSQGFKANVSASEPRLEQRRASVGRAGGGRELRADPDQIVIARAKQCPHCGAGVCASSQKLSAIYERLELPPVRVQVTRVERYGGVCEGCQQHYESPVPVGLEPGSPYGASIASLLSYRRYTQAVSYTRLSQLLADLYGLAISEGAIANLLQRVQAQLQTPMAAMLARLRQSRLIGSDETGARVAGKTQWEWVFQNEQVCVHVIRPTRGKQVIQAVMAGHRPEVWVSDLYSAQRASPAAQRQVCLAHQLRDCEYARESGDRLFAPLMKRLLLRAIALGRRRGRISAATFAKHRRRLDRLLAQLLCLTPEHEQGQRLQRRYERIQGELFLFLEDETIPPTNNHSEQALRPSVIFRKLTNGFRSEWGADLFASMRSLLDTAKRQGIGAFEAITRALSTPHADWLFT